MIQFNLLPDVKLEFVRAERIKHAVVSGAIIASGVALAIFLLLIIAVHAVQQKIINDQTAEIKKYSNELKNTPNLDKILTIQNQLSALPGLHAEKPSANRTFNLIQQMTPSTVALTDVTIDFEANTASFSGVSTSLGAMNTMADTIKYTNFVVSGKSKRAFSNVVVSEFSRNAKESTFTINSSYDPEIFDNTVELTFSVPSGVSTPSVIGQPTTQLFTKPTNESTNE